MTTRQNATEEMRPIPDPTILTTQQLHRELFGLREIVEARLNAMDRASEIVDKQITRVPSDAVAQMEHLKELHEEKFKSIQVQFTERDTRTEQTSRDSKVAVDAALQAAKEAVGEQNKSSALAIAKSETATTKQIDQQGLLIQTATAGLNDKIDDIKDRLTLIEGKSTGTQEFVTDHRAGVGLVVSVVSAVVSVLAIITVVVVEVIMRR